MWSSGALKARCNRADMKCKTLGVFCLSFLKALFGQTACGLRHLLLSSTGVGFLFRGIIVGRHLFHVICLTCHVHRARDLRETRIYINTALEKNSQSSNNQHRIRITIQWYSCTLIKACIPTIIKKIKLAIFLRGLVRI